VRDLVSRLPPGTDEASLPPFPEREQSQVR
jgi:hypothetical protein